MTAAKKVNITVPLLNSQQAVMINIRTLEVIQRQTWESYRCYGRCAVLPGEVAGKEPYVKHSFPHHELIVDRLALAANPISWWSRLTQS